MVELGEILSPFKITVRNTLIDCRPGREGLEWRSHFVSYQDEFLCFEWTGEMKRSSERLAFQRANSVPSDRIEK